MLQVGFRGVFTQSSNCVSYSMLSNYKASVLAPHHEEWTVSPNAEPDAKNRIEIDYLQSDSRKHWDSGDMNRKGEKESV